MFGYARITVSSEAAYVRFESVGNRHRFDILIDRFNQTFALKQWNETKRMWEIPLSDFDSLVQFGSRTFGKNHYHVQYTMQ